LRSAPGKVSKTLSQKNIYEARCWWSMPVIPATQEAEIRRIAVQSQPGQIVQETLPYKNPSPKRAGGVQALSSNPSTTKNR
jgi:hypothetical protein